MPTRFRKVRKHRGSRSHGWGQSAGHRGAGSRGGHGKAGGRKHGWTYTIVHEPNRYRKHGFYHKSMSVTSMNVGELDQIANALLSKGQATKNDEGILIDLEPLGVDKLLGSGKVKKQFIVRVKAFSVSAEEKISKAKGQILNVE